MNEVSRLDQDNKALREKMTSVDLESKGAMTDIRSSLAARIEAETGSIAETQEAFLRLSDDESQRLAATVFFGDLIGHYSAALNDDAGFKKSGYTSLQNTAFTLLEEHRIAYAEVANSQKLTFHLEVLSEPPEAAIHLLRLGDPYKPFGETNTTLWNLTKAIGQSESPGQTASRRRGSIIHGGNEMTRSPSI